MPIWSLTLERLEKLKEAIKKKKAEHDELLALSEKDLWCKDLDEFVAEWNAQLALDAEIQTNIRRMGRRVSKKIGAGRGRKPKEDDDSYEPTKAKAKAKAKAPVKVETKSAQRFAEMFSQEPKVKKEPQADVMDISDNFSDDDFAALSRNKPAAKASQLQSEEPENGRTKRAAASKARTLFDADSDSDDDDDKMLGDVGALVKGIGKPEGESSGRLSLYAMNRPESSQTNGNVSVLPKTKSKSSKNFDVDSPDDTNYELLAKSSPHKTAAKGDDIDDFLSDDEPVKAPEKTTSTASAKAPAGLATVKKARGRPAGTKNKAKEPAKAKASAKATTLSPAAKAYAAKKAVKKTVLEDDSDEDMVQSDSPPPAAKPAPRGRPGRAAAARRPIVLDDEDSSMAIDKDEDSDDPFSMDDDDD